MKGLAVQVIWVLDEGPFVCYTCPQLALDLDGTSWKTYSYELCRRKAILGGSRSMSAGEIFKMSLKIMHLKHSDQILLHSNLWSAKQCSNCGPFWTLGDYVRGVLSHPRHPFPVQEKLKANWHCHTSNVPLRKQQLCQTSQDEKQYIWSLNFVIISQWKRITQLRIYFHTNMLWTWAWRPRVN